jgi:8-oxo-dGTP pyrophosphatase MutT (NUDIX family)
MLTRAFIVSQLRRAFLPGKALPLEGADATVGGSGLKCAAILLPLIRADDEWQVLFTRRTETVEHHKGQVSFPGGGCEVGEATPEATALREAREEIGLQPGDVDLLGRMNEVTTITHYRVTPVVGIIPWPYPVCLEPAEVVRLFTIPLTWLADPHNWTEQPETPQGVVIPFPVVKYRPYDGEVLWGISAQITHNFLHVLGLLE